MAGDLDNKWKNASYTWLLALARLAGHALSDFSATLDALLRDGDGVVPGTSANFTGLDLEAGDLTGTGTASAALRATVYGANEAHELLPRSAQVRAQLRAWLKGGANVGVTIN